MTSEWGVLLFIPPTLPSPSLNFPCSWSQLREHTIAACEMALSTCCFEHSFVGSRNAKSSFALSASAAATSSGEAEEVEVGS